MNPMAIAPDQCLGAVKWQRSVAPRDRLFFSTRPLLKYLAFALALSAAPEAMAVNRWFDCISGSLLTASCWSANTLPNAADTAYIGYSSYAQNVTATLASGTLNVDLEYIGHSTRNGTVTQTGGSHIVDKNLHLGFNTGITGTYNLQGGTLTTNNDGSTYFQTVGYQGTGNFSHSGGTHSSGPLYLGYLAGSTGNYNLSGTASLNAKQYLQVGVSGTGVFTQTGGTNSVDLAGGIISSLLLGAGPTGHGTYNLSAGSLTAGAAFVGNSGTGVFNQSGGMHTLIGSIYDGSLVVGGNSGSNGTYNLSGTGSLTANNETIGQSGTGTFTQTGGTHTVTNNLTLGANSGITGTYNLSGTGSLTASSATIGNNGKGIFNQTGGTHTITNDLTFGGATSNSYSLSGGTLNVGGNIVGNTTGPLSGLTINGGALNVSGNSIGVGTFFVAYGPGTNGSFTLGSGKTLTTYWEQIGTSSGSTGAFIQNGGTHVTSLLNIGTSNGSGSYTLNNGSLSVAGQYVVGSGSASGPTPTGVFTQAGGSVTANTLHIGNGLGIGSVSGTYNLNSGGLTAANENIGQSGGNGTFQHSGGNNTVSGTIKLLSSSATYNLQGGTLDAGTIENTSGGAFIFTGGTLAVDQFTGNLVNNGGTLAPGNSPGTTNITGNYTQSVSGIFAVEIGGLLAGSEYDVLNVSGTASLDGTLNVSLFDLGSGLFAPQAGNTFDILTAEILSGSFSSLSYAALLDPSLSWQIDYLTDAIGTTDVVRLSVVSAVPVPGAVWLFGSGLLGLMGLARRKNR